MIGGSFFFLQALSPLRNLVKIRWQTESEISLWRRELIITVVPMLKQMFMLRPFWVDHPRAIQIAIFTYPVVRDHPKSIFKQVLTAQFQQKIQVREILQIQFLWEESWLKEQRKITLVSIYIFLEVILPWPNGTSLHMRQIHLKLIGKKRRKNF